MSERNNNGYALRVCLFEIVGIVYNCVRFADEDCILFKISNFVTFIVHKMHDDT